MDGRITCSRCKQEKDANEENFGLNNRKLNGFDSWCKPCRKEDSKKYYHDVKKLHIQKHEPVMEGEKFCRKCHITKPVIEFRVNRQVSDGRSSYCNKCHVEFYTPKDKKKYKPKDGINANTKYRERYPEKWRQYYYNYRKKWMENPLNRVRDKAINAVNRMKLPRPTTCQKCGLENCKTYSVFEQSDLKEFIKHKRLRKKVLLEYLKFWCPACTVTNRANYNK